MPVANAVAIAYGAILTASGDAWGRHNVKPVGPRVAWKNRVSFVPPSEQRA